MTNPLERLRGNTKGAFATIAAAGTTQTDAAEMTADEVIVTSGAEGSGVVLPTLNLRDECIVCNGLNVSINVYPRTGGQLNNSTANTPVILDPFTSARFRSVGGVHVLVFV